MKYIAKTMNNGINNFVWTGEVEDNYVLEAEEIWLTEEEYSLVRNNADFSTINADGTVTVSTEAREQSNVNYRARLSLGDTDWKVLRELERLYLSGSTLNLEREGLRSLVVEE